MLCFVFVNASVNYRKASIEASFLVILLFKKECYELPFLAVFAVAIGKGSFSSCL